MLEHAPGKQGIGDAQAAHGERPCQHEEDDLQLERLQDIIDGADLHGRHGRRDRAFVGHDDADEIRVGDLRVAHFVGMHAFQVVPLFAYTLERYKVKSSTLWTCVFALIYFAVFTSLFVQAMLGKPLFSMFYTS